MGRALHSLQSVVLIEDIMDNPGRSKREELVFMNIRAETGAGNTNVVAVMRDSYASHLTLGFERIMLRRRCEKMAKDVRQAVRLFNELFGSSFLGTENRAHIPHQVMKHGGIPLFGRVFVAGRNGYAVISPNSAAISLIVGAVGIMNSMFTSVLERTRDIGVMKAVGARNSDIAAIFLAEAGIMGAVGGAAGVAIGTALAFAAGFVAKSFGFPLLSIKVDYAVVVASLLFSFVIGAIAGFVPAMQAARLKPVDALRYE